MWIEAFCDMPFNRVRVTAQGDVAMCCWMRPGPFQNSEDIHLGNLLKNKFDDIWFGEAAEKVRLDTKDGILSERCRCPGCPFLSLKPPYPKQNIVYGEYPVFLEIDLPNSHCNIGGARPDPVKSPACVMCERASPLFKPEEDHLLEVLSKIVHLVPNLVQIHIQGVAEPFWKDLIFKILDVLVFDNHKDRITVSTTTNATLLNARNRERYLNRVPHSITNVSLDAASPQTYQGIRILGGKAFERVLEHLYAFGRERVPARQFLRVTNNINLMNIHEVIGMVHIAHRAGVEYVEFNATDGFNHLILANRENCGRFARAQQDIVEECEKLGLPYTFLRPLDMGLTSELELL